jgi:hypothetical protein
VSLRVAAVARAITWQFAGILCVAADTARWHEYHWYEIVGLGDPTHVPTFAKTLNFPVAVAFNFVTRTVGFFVEDACTFIDHWATHEVSDMTSNEAPACSTVGGVAH